MGKDYDEVAVVKRLGACPELVRRDGDHCIAEYDGNPGAPGRRKFIYRRAGRDARFL